MVSPDKELRSPAPDDIAQHSGTLGETPAHVEGDANPTPTKTFEQTLIDELAAYKAPILEGDLEAARSKLGLLK